MICKRCEMQIPYNARHESGLYCRHCYKALLFSGKITNLIIKEIK